MSFPRKCLNEIPFFSSILASSFFFFFPFCCFVIVKHLLQLLVYYLQFSSTPQLNGSLLWLVFTIRTLNPDFSTLVFPKDVVPELFDQIHLGVNFMPVSVFPAREKRCQLQGNSKMIYSYEVNEDPHFWHYDRNHVIHTHTAWVTFVGRVACAGVFYFYSLHRCVY